MKSLKKEWLVKNDRSNNLFILIYIIFNSLSFQIFTIVYFSIENEISGDIDGFIITN